MAKQLIKNYSFVASTHTITCTDFSSGQPLLKERLQIIYDVSLGGAELYSFADATSSAAIASNNQIVLTPGTGFPSGTANADKLVIVYDTQPGDPNYSSSVPVTDAAAAASLGIMAIPIINKGKCAGGTLVAGAAGVGVTFQGGDTFTANELVIANLTGAAPLVYTLDGTAASAGGNTGAFAGTNGAALSALGTLTFSATTGLWGTSGIGTIVTSGGTHTFAWTGQSGSTLTGCTYSAPTSDTVATAAVITQLANAQGCIPSIGADIIPCNTSTPAVSLASTGVPQYLAIVRGA